MPPNSPSFKLTYDLEGAGWAMARVRNESGYVDISISYLRDSLSELAIAACDLKDGASTATVVFMDEPGEIHLVLTKEDDSFIFELQKFEDWSSWDLYPRDKYEVLLIGRTTPEVFVSEVIKELEALLQQHTVEGYKKKWIEHEFPSELLAKLRSNMRHNKSFKNAPSGPDASDAGAS